MLIYLVTEEYKKIDFLMQLKIKGNQLQLYDNDATQRIFSPTLKRLNYTNIVLYVFLLIKYGFNNNLLLFYLDDLI